MRRMYLSTGLVLFVLPRHENHHLSRFLGIFSFISLSMVACEGHAHRRNAQQLKNSQNKLSETKATRIKQMLDSHAGKRIDRNYCNELRKERNEAGDRRQTPAQNTHDWALQTKTHTYTHTHTHRTRKQMGKLDHSVTVSLLTYVSNYKCLVFVYQDYLIKNTVKTAILWTIITICVFYFNILWNVIHSCDQNWIFSIIPPVFSVTWSFRNHSNMLIMFKKHFWLLSMLKTVVVIIFLWKP